MEKKLEKSLQLPRFADGNPMLVAGLGQRFDYDNMDGLPALWQRFRPHIGNIPDEVKGVAYGVVTSSDAEGFDYIAGVEVTSFGELDSEFMKLRIPARHYAVFTHNDHISAIRTTMRAIWSDWLPRSGRAIEESPTLERYGPEFDARTGNGVVEIWLPVKK